MTGLIVVGMLVITFLISWWNAYSSGSFLTESKRIGGFPRFMVWCGLVMSACGFTWCYLFVLTLIGMHVPDFLHEYPEDSVIPRLITKEIAEYIFNLGYAVIILPILGSGLAIWVHSLIEAYRRRTFGSVAVAGWNTFAQGHNMYRFAKDAPDVWKVIEKLFSGKGDVKGKVVILVVVIVIMAVLGGILTTMGIAKMADKKFTSTVKRK
jgi:hypothetical protein